MDQIDTYISSHEAFLEEEQALREWEMALASSSIREKCCLSLNVYNGVPVQPLLLQTKESKSLLGRLSDKAQKRVYSLHRMIMVIWAPAVLKETSGTLSMVLMNLSSGEKIEICRDHQVSQASTFVTRWPRALESGGKGLALLPCVEGVPVLRGALVGVLHPYWEDKLSTKMVYEKQLPTLAYPLEEQEPAIYVKDSRQLRSAMLLKFHAGTSGNDVTPHTIGQLGSTSMRRTAPSLPALESGTADLGKGRNGDNTGRLRLGNMEASTVAIAMDGSTATSGNVTQSRGHTYKGDFERALTGSSPTLTADGRNKGKSSGTNSTPQTHKQLDSKSRTIPTHPKTQGGSGTH